MKIAVLSIMLAFLAFLPAYAQQVPVENDKSELPKLSRESLSPGLVVELYPNPSSEFLNISMQNVDADEVTLELYNVLGNKIDLDLDVVSSKSYRINVSELNTGYYLLVISDRASRFNKAFKFQKL
jgi:hypothetical protein